MRELGERERGKREGVRMRKGVARRLIKLWDLRNPANLRISPCARLALKYFCKSAGFCGGNRDLPAMRDNFLHVHILLPEWASDGLKYLHFGIYFG